MQTGQSSEGAKIVSPFAHSEGVVPHRKRGRGVFWGIGAALLFLVGAGGFFLTHYLHDPYRTLEVFPVEKYLQDSHALYGLKFKAELRVEADLGWKDGVGRLMLFSTTEDARPIAVMMPAAVAKDIYFTKGQTYLAEFEVKEGGLIYATACRKN